MASTEKRQRRYRNPESLPYITRMDYDKRPGKGLTRGWFVRITRDGKTKSGFFSDGVYGSALKARKVAIQYRDALLLKTRPALRGSVRGRGPYNKPKSGVTKLTTVVYKARDGYHYEYKAYVAWIRIAPTQIKSTKWSVEKWGKKAAYDKCERWLKTQRKLQAKNYAALKRQFLKGNAQIS